MVREVTFLGDISQTGQGFSLYLFSPRLPTVSRFISCNTQRLF